MKSGSNLKIICFAIFQTALSSTLKFSEKPQCSSKPDTLFGHQKLPEANFIHTNITSNAYSFLKTQQTILKNGCYKPPNCEAISKTVIIVPYRNRAEHLNVFLIHMHDFLQRQQIEYCIVVSEQINKGKFNKGILMNAAFEETKLFFDFDCVVFHDVDMLPENDFNMYSCKNANNTFKSPIHLSTKIDKYNYKYPYGTDFGGVTMLSRKQYETTNGHSNLFWGWGREDSDIEWRVANHSLTINTPQDVDFGRYTMMYHKHMGNFQNEMTTRGFEDDRTTSLHKQLMSFKDRRSIFDGLNSLRYNMVKSDSKLLYTGLGFDVELVRWTKISVTINSGENFNVNHDILIKPQTSNDEKCRFILFSNATTEDDVRLRIKGAEVTDFYKDNFGSKDLESDLCTGVCSGFQTYHSAAQKKHFYFPIAGPLLHRPNITSEKPLSVFVKSCENDWESWQVFMKNHDETIIRDTELVPAKIFPDRGEIELKFDLEGTRKFKDQGTLYYRDAWIFEGQRFMSFNIPVLSTLKTTEFTQETLNGTMDGIVVKTQFTENQITGAVQMNVGLKMNNVADGFYAVYSKIVDSYGQPYAEVKFLFEVENTENRELNAIYSKKMQKRMAVNYSHELDSPETKEMMKLFKRQIKCEFSQNLSGEAGQC